MENIITMQYDAITPSPVSLVCQASLDDISHRDLSND